MFGCVAETQGRVLPKVRNFKVLEGIGLEAWVDINSGDDKLRKLNLFQNKIQHQIDALSTDVGKNQRQINALKKYLNVKITEDFRPIVVGNKKLLKQFGGKLKCSDGEFKQYELFSRENPSYVILIIAIDDQIRGLLSLADQIRDDSKNLICLFKNDLHIDDINIITGDSDVVAQNVSLQLYLWIDY